METYCQVKWESGYISKCKVSLLYSSTFCLLLFNYLEIYTEEEVQARKLEYICE